LATSFGIPEMDPRQWQSVNLSPPEIGRTLQSANQQSFTLAQKALLAACFAAVTHLLDQFRFDNAATT
jgi:hypothetical protein